MLFLQPFIGKKNTHKHKYKYKYKYTYKTNMDKEDIFLYTIIFLVLGASLYIYFGEDTFQLKCIVSTVDGNKYCVRDREKLQDAADLMARVANKCKDLVQYAVTTYPDNEAVSRLAQNFKPEKMMETLPTSELTAYSESKGEKLAFCLNREKKGEDQMIDEHTLTFVAIHELSHLATESIGHKTDFWENFQFLLKCAKECGVHDPKDYKKNPAKYCGMKIRDSPYFDDFSKSSEK